MPLWKIRLRHQQSPRGFTKKLGPESGRQNWVTDYSALLSDLTFWRRFCWTFTHVPLYLISLIVSWLPVVCKPEVWFCHKPLVLAPSTNSTTLLLSLWHKPWELSLPAEGLCNLWEYRERHENVSAPNFNWPVDIDDSQICFHLRLLLWALALNIQLPIRAFAQTSTGSAVSHVPNWPHHFPFYIIFSLVFSLSLFL